MKDIFEILKEHGIEVSEDKQKDVRRAVSQNYKTVNEMDEAVKKVQGELETSKGTITKLNGEIETLKANGADVESLKQTIADYEAKEKQRAADEAAATELKALKDRFAPLRGDKSFLNEGTENWIFNEFKAALEFDENKGKSDAEIYDAVTKDKNIYENPNKTVIPPAGNIGGGTIYKSKDEIMSIKDSSERLKAIQANPNLFRKE